MSSTPTPVRPAKNSGQVLKFPGLSFQSGDRSSSRKAIRTKYLFIILAAFFALALSSCVVDRTVGFQGYLTDPSGTPVNGSKEVVFRFFTSTTNCASGSSPNPGNAAFTETHNNVSVTNGLLNVEIGSESTAANGLSGIDPAVFAQPLYLEVVVDGEALQPCQKVMGAPYAMSLVGGAVMTSLHEGDGAAGNDSTDANYGTLTVVASGANGTSLMLGVLNNGGDLIRGCSGLIAAGRSCPNLRFRVTSAGDVSADGAFTPGGADFAELVQAAPGSLALEPGDVLVISREVDRAVVLSGRANSTAVFGVYSTQPGFVGRPYGLAAEGRLTNEVPVAIVGIVPVKVSAENGAIQRGDLLATSATPGHAMKASDPQPGSILGKALGELSSGTGIIEVLLMLR